MRVLILLLLALSACAHDPTKDAYYQKYCIQDSPYMTNLAACPKEAIDEHYKPWLRPKPKSLPMAPPLSQADESALKQKLLEIKLQYMQEEIDLDNEILDRRGY